ncbi:hypothetical protein Y1Q_0011690 [Alligator mississippiensis]|uniref:Uncharacterized protein n=1 Tax=Alligator mississippiensis TaxID=8496 RepID=A0A151M0S3_ALLMI|nr:hypothetical protein Y1Q_0011690 [Alligator mississippiensis]
MLNLLSFHQTQREGLRALKIVPAEVSRGQRFLHGYPDVTKTLSAASLQHGEQQNVCWRAFSLDFKVLVQVLLASATGTNKYSSSITYHRVMGEGEQDFIYTVLALISLKEPSGFN